MTPNGSGRHAIPSITNASLTAIDNGAVVMAAKYGIHKHAMPRRACSFSISAGVRNAFRS
jgi:hypothetical protein